MNQSMTLSKDQNPYSSTAASDRTQGSDRDHSTWARNFACLLVIATGYCGILILATTMGLTRLSHLQMLLAAVAFIASTWSNFQVGARIGWRQGGMPVMVILVFGWGCFYILASMLLSIVAFAVLHLPNLPF
ncbi:hypothetical protein Poly51_61070 [Rubripirellula tenax]|uniref:Uncharacterized protein n=2 Tax=Rubripirellula tenax TaxID=2528015 RepID=A0A5C6E6W1_9BACT|nr:hypothetical protein Poly51_61070 [Rubripirellula tenax]